MKIKKIEIENFKSLKKVSIDSLLEVNMIYGYNNSGKSNLLKFLELVFWAPERTVSIPIEISGPKTTETQTRKESFWKKTILDHPFIFRKEGDKYFDISFSITIELDKTFLSKNLNSFDKFDKEFFKGTSETINLVYKGTIERTGNYQAQQNTQQILLNGKEIFSQEENGAEKTFANSKTLNYNDFESLMSLFNDCIILLDNDRYFTNEKEQNDDDNISPKNFKNKMFSLSLAYLKDSEYKSLNSFLKSFKITSDDAVFNNNEMSSPFHDFQFEFIRVGTEIEIILTNQFGKFPLSSFGTGVQQIIFILTKIFLANKKIVLIEEIELNLSPKYQLEIIDFIFKKLITAKVIDQLFYTTHSPLMSYRSEFRSLQARIDVKGVSSIQQINPVPADVAKFKAAMKLLEHYHPNVPAKPTGPVAKAAPKKVAPKKVVEKKAAPRSLSKIKKTFTRKSTGAPKRKKSI